MANIIAIHGQLANGKDVLADHLAEKLNNLVLWDKSVNEYRRNAFASAVKNVFCDAFGVDRDFIEKWKRIPEPPEGMLKNVRQSLQFIGDGFRTIRPNIWIEIAMRGGNQIISDGRYINEAKTVYFEGGFNILVGRPDMLNDDPNLSESEIRPVVDYFLAKPTKDGNPFRGEIGDESEPHLYYHHFVRNDAGLDELYQYADSFLIPHIRRFFDGRGK